MDGGAVGTVVASKADGFEEGDQVLHFGGWRDEAVIAARFFRVHVVGGVEILDFSTNLAGELFSIERLNFADAILAFEKALKKGVHIQSERSDSS